MKPKRVALYFRVSTEEQNIALQQDALRSLAATKGLTVVQEYQDLGVSGSKTSRPALNELMRDAQRGSFDVVMVWRFDRFARSTRHLIVALEEFKALHIDFVSHQEALDTSTPMGLAMFTIIGALAQLERDVLLSRTNAGIAAARAKGVHLGRPMERDNQSIQELRRDGYSHRQIATRLGCSVSSVQRALRPIRLL